MICEMTVKSYCKDFTKIENYASAVADTTQTWEVHHRLESCFTQKFLKNMGLYYNVEPEALIFLTKAEHCKIDSKCKRHSKAMKGKELSEEHRAKISAAIKGKKITPHSEEHKAKLSAALKGRHWKLVEGKRIWY